MNLPWLLNPPPEIGQRMSLLAKEAFDWDATKSLARLGLNLNQLIRLADIIQAQRVSLGRKPSFRMAILSNGTTDLIERAIVGTAPRFDMDIEPVHVDFGQVMQAVIAPDSAIYHQPLDGVLLCLDYRAFRLRSRDDLADAISHLETLRRAVRDNSTATCIFQTIARPAEPVFGNLDRQRGDTPLSLFAKLNEAIVELAARQDDLVLDAATIAENVGISTWYDPRQWHMGKFSFSQRAIPLYADHVCRLVAAAKGKSRRCLVLDLDNTIWGGVIGDDGVDGIVIGQGDGLGEAFLDFQRTVLMLRDRGIVVAVCSKNTDHIARMPFESHPDMLLRLDHVASFKANWDDKASNIREIAKDLSLGLDAFVFVDDNPLERDLVRTRLPDVAVPEMPADPGLYARTLLMAGYFETVTFSEEDKLRASAYAQNAKRDQLRKETQNVDDYLETLEMRLEIALMDSVSRSRIHQLIGKSNQFNLTTKRYSLQEIESMAGDKACHIVYFRLTDKFGDNGIISAVICQQLDDDLVIDTWVMSCRVLGRHVEEAILAECCRRAVELGCQRLRGTYIPTARNGLVASLYEKLGFQPISTTVEGTTDWVYELSTASTTALPIQIVRKS